MHYRNGERTFCTDFKETDDRGYYKVTDVDTNVVAFFPENTVKSMKYLFSWDRYHDDLHEERLLEVLETELARMKNGTIQNKNIKIGMLQLEGFIKEMKWEK